MLGIGDVSTVRNQSIIPHRENPLNILEPSKTPKTRCTTIYRQNHQRATGRGSVPRLSAARTMPSLYFMARTLVATILGSCVCVTGMAEASVERWKDGWTGCIGSTLRNSEDDIVAGMDYARSTKRLTRPWNYIGYVP